MDKKLESYLKKCRENLERLNQQRRRVIILGAVDVSALLPGEDHRSRIRNAKQFIEPSRNVDTNQCTQPSRIGNTKQFIEPLRIANIKQCKTQPFLNSREIREIEDSQEKEIQSRELDEKEQSEAKRLASSFVEHLDGHQLFDSLWRGDEDGRVLMLVGPQAQELFDEYDKDIFELTQEIYKLGLERFIERDDEVRDFMNNLNDGQEELQLLGQKKIDNFLQFKENLFEEARLTLRQLEQNLMHGEDEDAPENLKLSDAVDKLNIQFEDSMNDLWQALMTHELYLHEAIEVV
ncbi:dynein regulatory complex subunit 3-like [Drosophila gunungcola]|uniref:dynein regulatory complex subunit 3-like n=1 Tax=Drosophila gunungcola TaxID=103775 RepID=UPI0022E83E4C|nr:dynein regulatory complex subunit 3-like [Drosophila gunungcola]